MLLGRGKGGYDGAPASVERNANLAGSGQHKYREANPTPDHLASLQYSATKKTADAIIHDLHMYEHVGPRQAAPAADHRTDLAICPSQQRVSPSRWPIKLASPLVPALHNLAESIVVHQAKVLRISIAVLCLELLVESPRVRLVVTRGGCGKIYSGLIVYV